MNMHSPPASIKEIESRELSRAAFHEAGHLVLLRRYGGIGDARVWRNSAARIRAGETAWIGQVRIFAAPGSVKIQTEQRSAWHVVRPSINWRRHVGVAGLVAECLAAGIAEDWAIREELENALLDGVVSPSDLKMMGGSVINRDIAAVVRLLSEVWSDVADEAAFLTAGLRG